MSDKAPDSRRPMHFKRCCIIRNTDLGGKVFEAHDPEYDVRLILRDRPKDAKDPPYVSGDGVCEASCTRQVALRLEAAARRTGVLSFDKGPVQDAVHDLDKVINRALRIMRWRLGTGCDPNPIRAFTGFFWSLDGLSWNDVTETGPIYAQIHFGFAHWPWSDDIASSVEKLIFDKRSEPLAHELFVEAVALQYSSPRSSIVLAVTAAEVGFKQLAIDLVPGSKWLVENLASPPLVNMLGGFLPTLPIRRKLVDQVHLVPEPLLADLKKAVKLRNDIVHGGKGDLTHSTVSSALGAVRDLLYLLDLYSGFEWAYRIVSHETTRGLKEK